MFRPLFLRPSSCRKYLLSRKTVQCIYCTVIFYQGKRYNVYIVHLSLIKENCTMYTLYGYLLSRKTLQCIYCTVIFYQGKLYNVCIVQLFLSRKTVQCIYCTVIFYQGKFYNVYIVQLSFIKEICTMYTL